MSDDILNDDILPSLPTRLRLMRLGLGWSQEDLAHYSGIGVKTISSFENGSRIYSLKVLQLVELATACGFNLCELLSDPLESFGASAAVLQEIDRRASGERFREVRVRKRPAKKRSDVKRGAPTQVPSSSDLSSPLGWEQR